MWLTISNCVDHEGLGKIEFSKELHLEDEEVQF